MSDEFDDLAATEKAGFEAALNRCRRLAAQIASELVIRGPSISLIKLALADLCAFPEHAADVLGQKSPTVDRKTPTPGFGGAA
jgi:hypothetical protein